VAGGNENEDNKANKVANKALGRDLHQSPEPVQGLLPGGGGCGSCRKEGPDR
jgi:hypothetical protein